MCAPHTNAQTLWCSVNLNRRSICWYQPTIDIDQSDLRKCEKKALKYIVVFVWQGCQLFHAMIGGH